MILARNQHLIVKKIIFSNFFVRIFGQKSLFLLLFSGLPAITRRYGQFVVIHMSYDKFCLRKNGANSGRTPKNAIFWHQLGIATNVQNPAKWAPTAAPRPAVQRGQHKNVVFYVSSHNGDNNYGQCLKKIDFGPKNCIFGPKICIFLRYTYETPIFSGQTVPTQWDHKSPIS